MAHSLSKINYRAGAKWWSANTNDNEDSVSPRHPIKWQTDKNTFKQSLFNSIVVTSGTVILSLVINVLAGYAVSLLKLPYKNFYLNFYKTYSCS